MSKTYNYTLTPLSYSLPILHAARHPSSTVLGVFLGSTTESSVVVDEAIPLVHAHTALSPIAEAALSMVEAYARSVDKRIVGVYVAPERERGLGRSAERILAALREFDGVFGLVIDNDKLGAGLPAYTPFLPSSSTQFAPVPSSSGLGLGPFHLPASSGDDLPRKVLSALRTHRVHVDVHDFDESLDDPSADWLENKAAKASIAKYIA